MEQPESAAQNQTESTHRIMNDSAEVTTNQSSNHQAVQIAALNATKDSVMTTINLHTLCNVIHQNGIEDLPLMVIAVAGKSRRGKSYLLSVMRAYLEHISESPSESFQPSASEISGMRWGGGRVALTEGFWLWDKAYKLKREDNSEVAVMLLDTQGICDGIKSANGSVDSQVIYVALSMATIYIHNISRDFQMPERKVYQICKNLYEALGETPENGEFLFNSFTLLYRDWVEDEAYGSRPEIFKDEIENARQDKEAFQIMKGMDKAFKNKTAWVFPVPSEALQRSRGNISLAEGGVTFQDCVREFLEALFSPHGEYMRQIDHTVTGKSFLERMECLAYKLENFPHLVSEADQVKQFFLCKVFDSAKKMFKDTATTTESINDFQKVNDILAKAESSANSYFRVEAQKYKPDDQILRHFLSQLSGVLSDTKELYLSKAKHRIMDHRSFVSNLGTIWPFILVIIILLSALPFGTIIKLLGTSSAVAAFAGLVARAFGLI